MSYSILVSLSDVSLQNGQLTALSIYSAGSTAYLVGLFLGHAASKMEEHGNTPGGEKVIILLGFGSFDLKMIYSFP